jgi:hypothetical protein
MLVAFTITCVAAINSPQAMEKKEWDESSLSSDFGRSVLYISDESQIYSASNLGSWIPPTGLPQGSWLGESMAPDTPNSYLWGYIRDLGEMCSAISNKISGITWSNIPHLSNQPPSDDKPSKDLDEVVEEFHLVEETPNVIEANIQS